jgi:hypothetical protein
MKRLSVALVVVVLLTPSWAWALPSQVYVDGAASDLGVPSGWWPECVYADRPGYSPTGAGEGDPWVLYWYEEMSCWYLGVPWVSNDFERYGNGEDPYGTLTGFIPSVFCVVSDNDGGGSGVDPWSIEDWQKAQVCLVGFACGLLLARCCSGPLF